MQSPI